MNRETLIERLNRYRVVYARTTMYALDGIILQVEADLQRCLKSDADELADCALCLAVFYLLRLEREVAVLQSDCRMAMMREA
jgi:hypothetical protein